jgi:hypothetical protein
MNVAAAIVEAEDDVVVNNLLEAFQAGYCVNRGDVRCWHIHHKGARRGGQGGSCFRQSSAPAT